MRKLLLLCLCLFLVFLSLVSASACRGQQPASDAQPEYAPTATIKDIMIAIDRSLRRRRLGVCADDRHAGGN